MAFSTSELATSLPANTGNRAWVVVVGCGSVSRLADDVPCISGTDRRDFAIDHTQGLTKEDLAALKVALDLALQRITLDLGAEERRLREDQRPAE